MLPIYNSDTDELTLMQTRWAAILNPLLGNVLLQGRLIRNVALVTGSPNEVNHKLGRKLTGWIITRKGADAAVYDAQDANLMPQLTLSLITDADVTIDLWVF